MSFTRASYSFAANGDCPAATFFMSYEGNPAGAVRYLREMLLDTGAVSAEAFERASQAKAYVGRGPSEAAPGSFRYHLDGLRLVAEERTGPGFVLAPGADQWNPVFSGSLLDFIQSHSTEPMLHATGPRAEGEVHYTTLDALERNLAEAQAEAIRYEAGVFAVAGETAAERVEELRGQVLAALRAELRAGRAEAGNYDPRLKTYTVIAEIWDNEQGYAATVRATDDDEAIERVRAEYRAAAAAKKAASGEPVDPEDEDEDDEDSEDGLLRIWAVLEGTPEVVLLRDAD